MSRAKSGLDPFSLTEDYISGKEIEGIGVSSLEQPSLQLGR
jgi:hypothetical protein